MAIEETFKDVANVAALAVEAASVAVVVFGALQAFARVVGLALQSAPNLILGREIWLRFAVWIALSLEFALAADLIRTAVAIPTWAGIGQLAAIAAIRTALNFFLERDIEAFKEKTDAAERPPLQAT
ncbi:MAG: DUF1622 domain-containing protein [Hyphomicrobiaceae bacterium]